MQSDRNGTPVITGCGVVAPIGIGKRTFWQSILAGVTGIQPVTLFDTTGFATQVAGEISDSQDLTSKRLSRAGTFAADAAAQALNQARLVSTDVELLMVGTTAGTLAGSERDRAGTECNIPKIDLVDELVQAIGLDCTGATILNACAAGSVALERASQFVRRSICDKILVGGAEGLSRLSFIGFSRMQAMAKDRCRPFDVDREGVILGEGSAFFVVESEASAKARRVRPLARILGGAATCDAFHVATPSGAGAARAVKIAVKAAKLEPADIDFVSAHGTGTRENDIAESRALFEGLAGCQPPVSSLKALTGHSLGAASAIELAASVLSLENGIQVPQWGLMHQDPNCPVELALPGAQAKPPRTILKNAFAFGGNNSCLVLSIP